MKPTLILIIATAIFFITATLVWAQPPGLPSAPDQAPIDGGLGLLALAGGTYAWKRLRKR